MTPTNDQPLPDYTPEEAAAILAKYKRLFTVEDLIGYIDDDESIIPADEVMAKADEILLRANATGKGPVK